MTQIYETKKLLINHYNKYPSLQLQDIFKFLFQSTFGCEHMVTDENAVVDYIEAEYKNICPAEDISVEQLDGDFCRVPLSVLGLGLSVKTLGRLFLLSSEKTVGTKETLSIKTAAVRELIDEKILPFDKNVFEKELEEWKGNDFPALHHSDIFRKEYKPSYRVISKEFIPFLTLFASIDKGLADGNMRLAVEGGSASGKTTLSEIFESVYDCTILHTDDFFLQPSQRTPERLQETGGNLDYERFLSEVLNPLSKNKPIGYRRFDCGEMKLMPPVEIIPKKLTIIEGAYSMHPLFGSFYNFSVFLDVDEAVQKNRIKKRNSPFLAERFFNEWIPMEMKYFSEFRIKEKCNMIIPIL